MHDTTQELLQALAVANDSNTMSPNECWGSIGQLLLAWRRAGKPDLARGEPIDWDARRRHAMSVHYRSVYGRADRAEWVTTAAVWVDDGIKRVHQPIPTGLVVCGHRHHNCLEQIADRWGDMRARRDLGLKESQGFLTSEGRYIDREEAMILAREGRQVISNTRNPDLFSEDLY